MEQKKKSALDNSEFPCCGLSATPMHTATNDTLQLSEQFLFRLGTVFDFREDELLVRSSSGSSQKIWQSSNLFGWMLHGSTSPLSGRSRFCQLRRKGKRCRCNIGYKMQRRKNIKKNTNQTTLQLPRECKGVESWWSVPRTIRAKAESTHVNRPKGKAPLVMRDG